MWCWKSKESKGLRFFLAKGAFFSVWITLSGVTSFTDFQEVRAALQKAEVGEVSLKSEAPGLIVFKAPPTSGQKIMEALTTALESRYTLTKKLLPSGEEEITVSKKD